MGGKPSSFKTVRQEINSRSHYVTKGLSLRDTKKSAFKTIYILAAMHITKVQPPESKN